MRVKTHAMVKGIPEAQTQVSTGERDNGQRQVTMLIQAVDSFDMSKVVCSLRLSPDEALDLANRLSAAAKTEV